MKTTEFNFNNENDLDAAVEIIIKMRERKPAPEMKSKTYTVVAMGEEEAQEFQRLVARRGLEYEVGYKGEIPDSKLNGS